MGRNELDMYKMQNDINRQSQEDLIRAQGEEGLKSYLPSLKQQFEEHQAIVIDQINPKRVVKEIILELDGKELTDDGDVVTVSTPYMNKVGLRIVKSYLRGILNQSNTMSSLTDKEIKVIMLRLADDFGLDLSLNWRDYGIKSRNNCDMIMNIVLINSFTILKRSQEQNEKRFLKGIAFESIGSGNQKGQQKGGGGWLSNTVSKLRL